MTVGLYNVLEPCELVNNDVALSFVRATPEFQPVELDDDAAGPLVAEGKLSAYLPGEAPAPVAEESVVDTAEESVVDTAEEPVVDTSESSPRRGRRRADDEG